MRITSGIARGIALDSPKGDTTRPATDAARQAIFSSLGETVQGATILDMFAGTGAYGLEAASRGATRVVFAEIDRRAFACLKKNATNVLGALRANGAFATLETLSTDCMRLPKILENAKFDIVFADPPYRMLLAPDTLGRILETFSAFADEDTLFVLEAPADFEPPAETSDGKFALDIVKRLGKKSKGKPSQLIFKMARK